MLLCVVAVAIAPIALIDEYADRHGCREMLTRYVMYGALLFLSAVLFVLCISLT